VLLVAVPKPAPDRARGERRRRRRQRLGIGGVDGGGELVEQCRVGTEPVGLPREHTAHVALGDGVQQGQQLVADPVAPEPRVVVGGVVHGLDPEVGAQLVGVAPTEGAERAAGGVVPGQAVEARPAEQVEEDGLGLVVRRVAGEHVAREGRVPGVARPSLEVGAVGDLDRHRREARSDARRDLGDDLRLGRRAGAEPVVDVHGAHQAPGVDGEHQ
jgi:hypothetical protein